MKLKDWRKKRKLSQDELAQQLERYAIANYPAEAKPLKQTTLGYWERETLPRKFWLKVIIAFTKGQVGAGDFVISDKPHGC